MAVFGVQWLLPTQLILDLAAMAAPVISLMEVGIVVADLVGCTVLPLVVLALHLAMITVIAIVTGVVVHLALRRGSHVEVKLRESA